MWNLSRERFPFPPPNLPLSPPKTFGWWGGCAEGVPLYGKKEAAPWETASLFDL